MRIEPPLWDTDPYMPATWRVLAVLLHDMPLSQADLRERTGLSHPVVVQQVAQLRRVGLIRLGRPVSGKPGRPRIPITFNWDFCRLLAVEVHRSGITLQATNLSGNPIAEPRTIELPSWTQESIRQSLLEHIRQAMSTPGPRWAGVGIVLPGSVSRDGQTVTSCLDIPDWCEQALGEELSAELGLPVMLENEVDALARAIWSERPENVHTLVALSMRHDHRVVMGLLDEGHLLRSSASNPGYAGGIGHIPVAGNQRRCACGHQGCLETLLRESQHNPEIRRQTLDALATQISNTITAIRPELLVIQGDEQWSESDMEIIRQNVHDCCPPSALHGLRLIDRPYRATESLLGAVNVLASRILSMRNGELLDWVSSALA